MILCYCNGGYAHLSRGRKDRGTADVRREYFRNGSPAATGVVGKELSRPDALNEIDAVAVLDEQK